MARSSKQPGKQPGKQSGKKPGKQSGKQTRKQLDSLVPLLRGAPKPPRPPAPPKPPAPRGAPVSPPTLWLENEMRRLHNPADYVLLYEGWLQRYYRYHGRYPQDPKRAFRQAAQGCWNRILSG